MSRSLIDPQHPRAKHLSALREAVAQGHAPRVTALLDRETGETGLAPREAEPLLRDIVEHDHPVGLLALLVAPGVNLEDAAGTAVTLNRVAHLQALLALSDPPGALASQALITAVFHRNSALVPLLLDAGADADFREGKALRHAARHVALDPEPDVAGRMRAVVGAIAARADVGAAFLAAVDDDELGSARALIPFIPLPDVRAVRDNLAGAAPQAVRGDLIDGLARLLDERAAVHDAQQLLDGALPAASTTGRLRL